MRAHPSGVDNGNSERHHKDAVMEAKVKPASPHFHLIHLCDRGELIKTIWQTLLVKTWLGLVLPHTDQTHSPSDNRHLSNLVNKLPNIWAKDSTSLCLVVVLWVKHNSQQGPHLHCLHQTTQALANYMPVRQMQCCLNLGTQISAVQCLGFRKHFLCCLNHKVVG